MGQGKLIGAITIHGPYIPESVTVGDEGNAIPPGIPNSGEVIGRVEGQLFLRLPIDHLTDVAFEGSGSLTPNFREEKEQDQ